MDRSDFFAGPHRCRRCPATFSTRDKLERHVDAEHPGVRRARLATVLALAVLAVAALVVVVQPEAPPPVLESLHVDDDPALGSADAPTHVVVFESPSCASCWDLHADVLPALQGEVDAGRVAVHFLSAPPATGIDRAGGIAQECTHQETRTDGYLDFTASLQGNRSRLDEHVVHALLEEFAAGRGIPEEVVMRCYYAEESAAAVEEDWRVARAHDARAGTVLVVHEDQVTRTDVAGLQHLLPESP